MTKLLFYFSVAVTLLAQNPVSPTINTVPSREFGQPALLPQLNSVAPNLVEGRELNSPASIAFDFSVTPPILYVADTFNNRVLAFPNPNSYTPCTISGAPTCGFASPVVIGQRDLTSTLAGGPGTALSAGLNLPTSVAVDSSGNLYVLDAGNNRIVRFPKPLSQTGALLSVDLVIGQANVASGTAANQGQPVPSAQTLSCIFSGHVPPFASLAIDPAGNLWVSDPGNNRVLRFPSSQLAAGTSQPAADIVLGQPGFNLSSPASPPSGTPADLSYGTLYAPAGIAFSQAGDLYIADGYTNYSRVLYFPGGDLTPGSMGIPATRILGIIVQVQGQPTVTYPNNYSLLGPSGLFTVGNNLFVADSGNNRVVEYDVPANWPAAPSGSQVNNTNQQISPPMLTGGVIGQASFTSGQNSQGQANKGQAMPDNTTLDYPLGGASNGTDVWIVDAGNNRVTGFSQQGGVYTSATRLIGQLDFPYRAVNLIEGRELYLYGEGGGYGGVVIDKLSSPPHLYVADTLNNRVLCFMDARNVQAGSVADLVIGQTGPYYALVNSPTNSASQTSATGLNGPIGLAVDANGNLYVADSGNGRVVRFPAPFNQPAGQLPQANLVLGQSSLTGTPITDPSQGTMRSPWGLALFSGCFAPSSSTPQPCSLAVSDAAHNRVLIFKTAPGADFQSGQNASIVLGQQDFVSTSPAQGSSSAPASIAGMDQPTHIAVDTSDRLFVCDTKNNRVLAFTNTTNLSNGANAALPIYGFNSPQGIAVSQITGEIWVANTNASQIWRLPEYQTLILSSNPNNPVATEALSSVDPLALALDANDNVVSLEASNRMTFYYAALAYRNVASYNVQPIAPGQLIYMARAGLDFSLTPGSAASLPWPITLSGIQVLVNNVPAPVFLVSQNYIYFQVPTTPAIPQSGTADFVVMNASTQEILAATSFNMGQYNPAFFTANESGSGQVAAFNDDGSVNSASNPATRGGSHYIAFCLTGGGIFSGGPNPPPADGAAPTAAATTVQPVLLSGAFAAISNGVIPASDLLYSGAGCGFPGGWQINMKVDEAFAPGVPNSIALTIGDIPSSIGPAGTVGSVSVYFYVK